MAKDSKLTKTQGRPSGGGARPLIGVRLDPDQLEKLDRWRAQQPGVPTRQEAIRRLLKTTLG